MVRRSTITKWSARVLGVCLGFVVAHYVSVLPALIALVFVTLFLMIGLLAARVQQVETMLDALINKFQKDNSRSTGDVAAPLCHGVDALEYALLAARNIKGQVRGIRENAEGKSKKTKEELP